MPFLNGLYKADYSLSFKPLFTISPHYCDSLAWYGDQAGFWLKIWVLQDERVRRTG